MPEENNNQEEKPVEFYHEKDFLGQEKTTTDFIEKLPDITETEVTYSDYQSVKHFCILCIFSFGLYPFFWFFKHWQYLKDEKKLDISPSLRTVLPFIFGYSLFREFYLLAVEKGYKKRFPLFFLFLIYAIILILGALKTTIFSLIAYFSFILLIPVLNMMNFYYVKEQPDHKIRTKLSKGEKAFLLVIWGTLLFLAIFGKA